MTKEKKKLYYKILKCVAPQPKKGESEESKVVALEAYIAEVQASDIEPSDDVKTLSIVMGLTQKKVKEICQLHGYQPSKEPSDNMFGLHVLGEEKIKELLDMSEDDLMKWYQRAYSSSKMDQVKKIGDMEYIDTTGSYADIDLACVSLEHPNVMGLRAHAILSLQEITQMIKEGVICDLCIVAKTVSGAAVTVVPDSVSEANKTKIINTVFDSLSSRNTSMVLN